MNACIENCSVEAAWVEIGGIVVGGGGDGTEGTEVCHNVAGGDGSDDDDGGGRKFHDGRLGDDEDDEIDGGLLRCSRMMRSMKVLFYELRMNQMKLLQH